MCFYLFVGFVSLHSTTFSKTEAPFKIYHGIYGFFGINFVHFYPFKNDLEPTENKKFKTTQI